jgi:hypothetical protein
MRVTRGQWVYEIPEMWLIGRERAGRTMFEAIEDWIEQSEAERTVRQLKEQMADVKRRLSYLEGVRQ